MPNYNTMESSETSFTVHHVTSDDIPSLTTIVPRSFHPTNPYILKVSQFQLYSTPAVLPYRFSRPSTRQVLIPPKLLPNTPSVRQWWTEIFTSKLLDSPTTSHLLTAASSNSPSESLGVLSLQMLGPSDYGAGLWSTFSPTPDHDAAAYADVSSNLAHTREDFMLSLIHI